jgi:hypothetical protein
MVHKLVSLSALMVLVACGGNPFAVDTVDAGPAEEDLGGTTNPAARRALERFELRDSLGGGYVSDTSYDAATNTFTVDGLPFDGINQYNDAGLPGIATPFGLYEPNPIALDDINGIPVGVFIHRAVRGQSTSGDTQFAIIRTGEYISYGFGGFVFERNGSVTLPQSGFAVYQGQYAGLRDFSGRGGLEYVTGDMRINIDLDDFDNGGAIIGAVYNRQVFALDGTNVTQNIIDALNDDFDGTMTALPTITFAVEENAITDAGEISGSARSYALDGDFNEQTFEDGKFYGVISGEGADQEVVGVIVVQGIDPRYGNANSSAGFGGNAQTTVRETGGFILYR